MLDLAEDVAGSFCARLLADYGADVLKLEPPGGSALRRLGPFFHDDPHWEKSLFFLVMNLNKKGATLNLKDAAGRKIFKELVSRVDVVVESHRPGWLESLGLGYPQLEEINPGLVMTSITPFGQDGPYSEFKGEEVVNYAMGMIMSISGLQGREPLKHGGFQAQYEGGLNGAAATSMAIFMKETTGLGQHIDLSVTECVASSMMAVQTTYPFMGGVQTRRRATGGQFTHPMACSDGWIIVQPGGGASWEDIAEFFEAPELLEPRFAPGGPTQPERRGPGPDSPGCDQGPGQVGAVSQSRRRPYAVRAGPDSQRAGPLPPTGIQGFLPGGGPPGYG